MGEPQIQLTDSQVGQLFTFYEEHGTDKEKGIGKSVLIRSAPNLGGGYLEVAILDEDGEPTAEKRVLFPT